MAILDATQKAELAGFEYELHIADEAIELGLFQAEAGEVALCH